VSQISSKFEKPKRQFNVDNKKERTNLNNSSLALKHLLLYSFSFILVFGFCSTIEASLLKYDVGFDGADVGHMIFDSELGVGSQNLWDSLIDWNLSWLGVQFTSGNSQAAENRLFVANAAGTPIKDVEEELVFVCISTYCKVVGVEPIKYPRFIGAGGTSLGFHTSDFVDGVLHFGETSSFGPITYSAPSVVPIPSPATSWLFDLGLLLLTLLKRQKK